MLLRDLAIYAYCAGGVSLVFSLFLGLNKDIKAARVLVVLGLVLLVVATVIAVATNYV